jgi:hypothetical protein
MIYTELEKKLIEYTNDSENPETNFFLAVEYDKLNQTASAFSLYLRCADRTTDKNLQYECLIRAGLCFRRQGDRLYSEKSCWQNAIYVMPERPEAYFFMSEFFQTQAQDNTALIFLCTAENMAKNESSFQNFRFPITEYYGGLFEIKIKRVLLTKKCAIEYFPDDLKYLSSLEIVRK